jgi:cysteine sulfinate desulfinase/cysteine desulfurase-like protein
MINVQGNCITKVDKLSELLKAKHILISLDISNNDIGEDIFDYLTEDSLSSII